MAKTIVGLFDSASDAQAVVHEVVQEGVSRDQISVMTSRGDDAGKAITTTDTGAPTTGDDAMTGAGIGAALGGVGGLLVGLAVLPIPGLGPVIAAGPIATTLAGVGIGAATGGLIGALTHVGVPEEHAHHYAEGVRRGGTLVTVSARDGLAERVSDVMSRHHAVDVNERAARWREGGWSDYDARARAYTAAEAARERDLYSTRKDLRGDTTRDLDRAQVAIPVVEERVDVGKREVDTGGVKVRSRVVEQPVEQQVRLRDERVHVERHPADRAVRPGEASAFREGTMEFKETVEEPVVSKTARVVEEVVVNKDVRERTETVRDTVKHTEVEVEQDPRSSKPATSAPPRSTR